MIKRRLLNFAVLSVLGLAALTPIAAAEAADPGQPSFFDSSEIRLSNLQRFSKWTGALARHAAERERLAQAGCRVADAPACRFRDWLAFLETLQGAAKWEQLVAVNRYFNARPYIADRRNWGSDDHWATPGEFLSRSGDCEDYAIAKYLSLRELGWTDDELRVVAVKDEKLGLGHAILVVFIDDRSWVLDNQLPQVTATAAVAHYRPVYSINASAWWLHHRDDRA